MLTGELLRQLRQMKSLKQETVAKKLGISQPAYCKLEHAHSITGEKFIMLMKILNCTTEELEWFKRKLPSLVL